MNADSTNYDAGVRRQLDAMHVRLGAGMPRRGWKVGINVPEVQRRVGLQHPLVGWIDGDRVLADGAKIACGRGTRIHVEPELCIRLASDVEPGRDGRSVRSAIGGVAPALEIVDYSKPMGNFEDIVAHSMFHSATVVGAELQTSSVAFREELVSQLRFAVSGTVAEPARPDLLPADAGELVSFVANFLARFGELLLAGDLILSGSWTEKALPLSSGHEAIASFGALGTVRCEGTEINDSEGVNA